MIGAAQTGTNGLIATAGVRGTKHVVTQGRRCRPRLSGAFVDVFVLTPAEHVGERPRAEAKVEKAQAQRLRVGGFKGYL
jgi:hypothetical protein